jgi:APA family basic amino acid/polyamine antiporter
MTDPGPRPPALDRSLGLWSVTASGVGIIVGAGIYVLVGAAADRAGGRVWMSFVLAAVLSALTSLSYIELAAMFPRAGAEYEYARHVAPPSVAFVTGWMMVVGLFVAAAAVSLGFARYLEYFVDVDRRIGAVLLIASVTAVAFSGIRRSARMTVLLSLVQVGGLLLVIVAGWSHVGDVDLLSGPGGAGGVLSGAALVFFAFIGFDEVITLSEETRDPVRTIPRALLLALGISSLLYVLVAVVSVSVIGAGALASSPRPVASVLEHLLGDTGETVLASVALIATTNTTLLCLTASSRLMYGMASEGALPRPVARVSGRTRTPVTAIVIAGSCAMAIALVGDLTTVAGVTDFAVYLEFVAVNLTVIALRFTMPMQPRPFRINWNVRGVPVTPVLGLMTVALMIPSLGITTLLLGLVAVALGAVAYVVIGRGAAA